MEHILETSTIAATILSGVAIAYMKNRRKSAARTAAVDQAKDPVVTVVPVDDSVRSITIDQSAVRTISKHVGNSTVRVKYDETKRRSLAVGNQSIVPAGWQEIVTATTPTEDNPNPAPTVTRTEKLTGEFQYKFFGSQLMIGDRVIISSLMKKLHLLEITQQDQVFIDGVPQNIHIGDLEELKRIVRNTQR